MYTIRKATIADVESIRTIADQTWRPAYSEILSAEQLEFMLGEIYSADKIAAQIENDSQTYLLLIEDQKPVAFAAYSPVLKILKYISCTSYTACPKHKARAMVKY